MLRAFIVLPIYLACFYLAPRSPLYARFQEAVLSTGGYLIYHVAAYAAGLVIAVILALLMHFVWKPRTYVQMVLQAVFRMGLIGVVFTCGYQLFMFFTGGELSVIVLLVPIMFMAAELIYEFAEFVIASIGRLFGRKSQAL